MKYAHIVTTTTHKTLRGPRGGIIMMGKDFENPWGLKTKKGDLKKMSMLLNSAVFPGNRVVRWSTSSLPRPSVSARTCCLLGRSMLRR